MNRSTAVAVVMGAGMLLVSAADAARSCGCGVLNPPEPCPYCNANDANCGCNAVNGGYCYCGSDGEIGVVMRVCVDKNVNWTFDDTVPTKYICHSSELYACEKRYECGNGTAHPTLCSYNPQFNCNPVITACAWWWTDSTYEYPVEEAAQACPI